jgi:para-nitrobenzyl esterase
MAHRIALVIAFLAVFSAGCTQEANDDDAGESGMSKEAVPVQPAADELAGTAWQLVRINSMDDSVVTPDEAAKYTLSFGADGRVAVRADCNRGQGSWTSESAGQLQFGQLATTRAMCPPGSLHDRFLAELGYVRSYVLENNQLHLATMADGSIIDFEPMPGE